MRLGWRPPTRRKYLNFYRYWPLITDADRRAVAETASIGLTRSLHLAMNQRERGMAYEQRAKMLLSIQALAKDPTRESSLAIPTSFADTRFATEQSTLIGTPDEIITRLRDLQAVGVEYVLIIDVTGSLVALRQFAREVMPAFAEEHAPVAAR